MKAEATRGMDEWKEKKRKERGGRGRKSYGSVGRRKAVVRGREGRERGGRGEEGEGEEDYTEGNTHPIRHQNKPAAGTKTRAHLKVSPGWLLMSHREHQPGPPCLALPCLVMYW